MKDVLIVCWLFAGIATHGQTFIGESPLPEITRSAFYRVRVAPGLSSFLTSSYANLRITGPDNEAVPYFVESHQDFSYREFMPYTILEKVETKGCCTRLILENEKRDAINNIHLKIRNADVVKYGSLAGSDDGENWYVLRERILFTSLKNPSETADMKLVDFPLSNYRYYKLSINDSTSAPLNILSAGYYRDFLKQGNYVPVSGYTVTVQDDKGAGTTAIRISLDTLQWIDRLVISAEGTPLFRRQATLYEIEEATPNGLKEQRIFAAAFEMTNAEPSVVDLHDVKAGEFLITIENHDSPALRVDSVGLFQLSHFLVTYLEAGQDYKIKIGPVDMRVPVYDLKEFRHEIPSTTVLEPGRFEKYKVEQSETVTFFTREIMWLAIVGIILVLGFLSYRLVREAKVSGPPPE